MKTLIKSGVIASVATTAVMATAGMASASGLYSGGVLVPTGSAIAGQSTGNSTLTAGSKVVTCTNTTASGTVTANPGAGVAGDVLGNLSSLAFNNGTSSPDCTLTGVTGFSTASVVTNSPFAVNANASVFNVSKAGNIVATITLKSTGGGTAICGYDDNGAGAAAAVTGSTVKFTNTPLRKISGPAICPGTSTVGSANFSTAPINITTSGAAVSIVN